MNAQIKFFKSQEFWGKILIEGQSKDIYFNFQNVIGELRTLIEFNKYINEPIVFEIGESSKRTGEKEAINIKLDLTKRHVGHILSFDQERGIGTVKDFTNKDKIFFHYSAIRKIKADKYERVELNEPIVFSLGTNEKGKCALDILKIDERYFIEEFANYTDLKQSLTDLKNLAEIENWDYLKKPQEEFLYYLVISIKLTLDLLSKIKLLKDNPQKTKQNMHI